MSTPHPRFHWLTVCDVTRETGTAVSMAFDVPPTLARDYAFAPGQYLTLRATLEGDEVRRSYSICSGPDDGELRVAVKQVDDGLFSRWVNETLRVGQTLEVMTPTGRFGFGASVAGGGVYVAFVAGSGITPVLSILRHVLRREPASRFFLFYGNRTGSDVLFREALTELKDRYLQLPKDTPQRVRDEAARVAGTGSPYEQAVAIEAYLRAFPYDLTVPPTPAGRDVADFVLFDLKGGYFDTQSTAMAVMLRALGIPARLTVGYVLDKGEVTETTYTVRKDDQSSWVEVWFPRYGWVNFNPTADRPAAGAAGGLGAGGRSLDEILQNDPDLGRLFGDDTDSLTKRAADAKAALAAAAIANDGPPWTLIWSLVGALAAVAALVLSGRFAWNWGLGGIEGNARLWAKSQRLAVWARLGGREAETPREWSRRVGGAVAQPEAASSLATAYEETRYGRPDLERADPAETQSAYRRLRNTLAATVFKSRAPKKRT